MVDIVSEIGATVRQFDSADDALTYLLQNHEKCRMVIADHGVPGQIQGTELLKWLKAGGRQLKPFLLRGMPLTSPPSLPELSTCTSLGLWTSWLSL
ncbi:hypothetical protein [Pseudomonas tolaasii]